MGWSTTELAELAGTSERTVRHYHDVGLLPLPERRANGYKAYGLVHLVRLLRVKRLADLGFSLARIAEMDGDGATATEAIDGLDAELAATVERLQGIRGELARMRLDEASADLPLGFARRPDLTEQDRSVVFVLSRLLGPDQQENFRRWLGSYEPTPADREFDVLAPDADERTRADLAERMLPAARQTAARRGPDAPGATSPRGDEHARRAVGQALREIYNPAQLDVLRRVSDLLQPPSEQT